MQYHHEIRKCTMEERITKEELLERLFHDDYENLKGRRLRLTRVRVPGKELSFAHVLHQMTDRYMRILRYISVFMKVKITVEMPSAWSVSHPGRQSWLRQMLQ